MRRFISTSGWEKVRSISFDALFRALREMDFANRTFKVGGEAIITTSLFGYPENERSGGGNARERIERSYSDVKTGGFMPVPRHRLARVILRQLPFVFRQPRADTGRCLTR